MLGICVVPLKFYSRNRQGRGRMAKGRAGWLSCCGLRLTPFGRGVVATLSLSLSDNKKQFATHWALTTTNDNRHPPACPAPFLSLSFCVCLSVAPLPLERIRACCSFVTNATIWPNGPSGLLGLGTVGGGGAIKSFCSLNAFSPSQCPIICDIRSLGVNGQVSRTLRPCPDRGSWLSVLV